MNGLPPADRRVELVARIVAVVGVVWFALAAGWQIAGPFGSGHVAATAARGIIAENMHRWDIWAPVRDYTLVRPPSSMYYAHHPWGIFWLTGLVYDVFGRHDFVCRLAPVLESIGTAMLCYGLGRALWGPVAGALATCAYVVLPITLSFANFNGFEVPLVFGMMLTAWGYVRFSQTWNRRWMAVSLVGLLFTLNTDWESLVFAGVALAVLMASGFILPRRWFGGVDARRFGQWWMLATSVAVGTVLGYLALFHIYGALGDLFAQGRMRANGNSLPLSEVLKARSYWIELMFTPLAILVGKIGVVLLALRLIFLRRVVEVFPLAMLTAAAFEYIYFKEGADVHIYWPFPFSPLFALGLGVLAATIAGAVSRLVIRLRRRPPGVWLQYTTFGCLLLVPLAMVRDAVRTFEYGRDTGDRFDEGGRVIYQDLDKHAALAWIHDRLAPNTVVDVDQNMAYFWSQEWTLERPGRVVGGPIGSRRPGADRYFITDARNLSGSAEKQLVDNFHVHAVGPIWFVDYTQPQAPLDALALVATRPSLWNWYLRYGNDPEYHVVPSQLRTWELRYHFGQRMPYPSSSHEKGLDATRILHNVAVAEGDTARADKLEKQLVAELDRRPATVFKDKTRLLGVKRDRTARRLWILFRAAGPEDASAALEVRSYVSKPMPWSLIPADPKPRVVGARFEIAPSLWKAGFIYMAEMEVRPRPGTEQYFGYWSGRGAPRPVSGPGRFLLLTTP